MPARPRANDSAICLSWRLPSVKSSLPALFFVLRFGYVSSDFVNVFSCWPASLQLHTALGTRDVQYDFCMSRKFTRIVGALSDSSSDSMPLHDGASKSVFRCVLKDLGTRANSASLRSISVDGDETFSLQMVTKDSLAFALRPALQSLLPLRICLRMYSTMTLYEMRRKQIGVMPSAYRRMAPLTSAMARAMSAF